MLLHGTLARADFTVTYLASGTFSGGGTPNTSTYTQPDAVNPAQSISIVFNPTVQSVTLPTANPTSQVSFGQFSTNATTATNLTTLTPTTFTLNIQQTSPTSGALSFVGTLQGQLRSDTSGAFIQFSQPLSKQLDSILYQITSADSGTPGRVNIAPRTTNSGLTTIVGQVTAVPEPGSLMLLALGCPIVLGLARRGRRMDRQTV